MSNSVDPSFFPPVDAPRPPTYVLDGINDFDARLIFDLVAKLRPAADVLVQYNLTTADLHAKAQSPVWAAWYRETERVWKSDMKIQDRIRLKAAFLLEDSLRPLFEIITSTQMPVNAKLEAIKQLTAISNVGASAKEVGSSEKHSITINIGGGKTPAIISMEKSNGRTTIEAA